MVTNDKKKVRKRRVLKVHNGYRPASNSYPGARDDKISQNSLV